MFEQHLIELATTVAKNADPLKSQVHISYHRETVSQGADRT